jgi:hypothetical protein
MPTAGASIDGAARGFRLGWTERGFSPDEGVEFFCRADGTTQ